jgi:(2Fe-2S) ferredoxin
LIREGFGLARSAGEAVVLLGRGAYGGVPGEELRRLGAELRATGRYAAVREAVADRGRPGLPAALEACGAAERIVVVPATFSLAGSELRWLKKVACRWALGRMGSAPQVLFAGPLCGAAGWREAVERAVAEGEPVSAGDFGSLEDPAGWSEVPAHERHVLACSGPRCTARGAGELWGRLQRRLRERGLLSGESGGGRVLVAGTGCLYPCGLGPMLVVHPEGVWYGVRGPEAVDRIVAEHLEGGEVVREYARVPAGAQPGVER